VPVDPGSIAYASGALANDPQAGIFRVAQIGICATAPGQATLYWQFSTGQPAGCDTGAPTTRDTEIVVSTGDLVENCTLFTNYTFTVTGGANNTPTATPA